MLDMLEDIKAYLEGAGIGASVYASQLPDPEPGVVDEVAVGLLDYSGLGPVWVQPQNTLDMRKPRYGQPRVQVNARGAREDYLSGETLSNTAYLLISQIVNTPLLSGRFYQSVSPLQEPFLQRWDQNRRPIFTFNAQVFLTN